MAGPVRDKPRDLRELAGALSVEQADELAHTIAEGRSRSRARRARLAAAFGDR